MTNIIPACILFSIAAAAFILSFRSFREKGLLLNNAYLYASKKERETMDKKPHYRQSAIVFLLVGIIFLLNGLAVLLELYRLSYIAIGVIIITAVYAVTSGTKKQK